jgi:hypothetical protein
MLDVLCQVQLHLSLYYVTKEAAPFPSHVTAIISLNIVNQLIFVMVKYGVLFEVRTEFLNNI